MHDSSCSPPFGSGVPAILVVTPPLEKTPTSRGHCHAGPPPAVPTPWTHLLEQIAASRRRQSHVEPDFHTSPNPSANPITSKHNASPWNQNLKSIINQPKRRKEDKWGTHRLRFVPIAAKFICSVDSEHRRTSAQICPRLTSSLPYRRAVLVTMRELHLLASRLPSSLHNAVALCSAVAAAAQRRRMNMERI
ncbi:hypothetical protein Dimus_015975 [Dionaea muscipula]